MERSEASSHPSGTPDVARGLLKLLKRCGLPETLENYLDLAYVGHPPISRAEIDEDDIPEQLRGQLDAYFEKHRPAKTPKSDGHIRLTPVDHDPFAEGHEVQNR
jgi:hypothetical protein